MRQLLAIALFAACVLGLVAAPAAAQDARDLFMRGQSAYDSGDYDTAVEAWTEAHRLDPRPLLLFNLAQAYERLGRLDAAIESYQGFVNEASSDDERVQPARARISAIQQRLSNTAIRLIGGPEGAVVLIDGEDRGRLPRPDAIRVPPGSHRIVVRAAGYEDFVSTVAVSGGQSVDVPVEMRTGEGGGARTGGPSEGGGFSPSPIGLIVAAGGAALLIASAVTGGVALANAGDAPAATGPEADDARTLALVTDILWPVGLAALAVGVVLTFVLGEDTSEDRADLSITPVAGPGYAGVGASGRF